MIQNQNQKRTLGYVLLSGGIDSTTVVARAVNEVGYRNVRCVSVDYGQRHIRELEAASKIAAFYGRPHHLLNLSSVIPDTLLKDPTTPMPDVTYADIKGVSPSYVPFRNGLMLSALASHVHGELIALDRLPDEDGALSIEHYAILYAGMHAEDAAGGAYPDCTLEFIGAMANAIKIGTYDHVRLNVPFIHSTKQQIIEYGLKEQVPYHLTWSCYSGGEKHCGKCSTCYARAAAFINAHASMCDPTEYEIDPKPVLFSKGLID